MERKKIGIFISVYHRIPEFKRCMDSILMSDLTNHDVAIFVGFNGGYQDAEEYLIDVHHRFEKTPIKFHTIVPNANIGKGKLVNLMSTYCSNLDFLVSIDGDIEITCINWLDIMLESYYSAKDNGIKIGALAPMFQEHDVHLFGQGCDVIKELSNKFHFVYREDNVTAGPLFFIPIDAWKTIGGYEAHRIYASDDGHFCAAATKHGYKVGMIPEISVIHPFESNKDYINWKFQAAKGEHDNEEGFYD